jgi:hypothetical protein
LELKVFKALSALKAHKDSKVFKDQLVHKAHKDSKVFKDQLVHKAHKDSKVFKALSALKVLKVVTVTLVEQRLTIHLTLVQRQQILALVS